MIERNIKLLPVQMDLLKCNEPIAGIYSSRAAGKTYCASILSAIALNNNERILVLAQNYKSLSENIFCEIINRLDDFKVEYQANKSNLSISNSHGGKIITGSYESLDSLRGLTNISLLILDESAYAPVNLFAIVAPCLRGNGIKPKIRFFSSPKKGSWFSRYLKENNITFFTSTIYDNVYLTEESRALMEASVTNEAMRKQELYGAILDEAADNAIITRKQFSKTPNTNLPSERYYIGIDCSGFGKDNNAIIVRNDRQIVNKYIVQVANSDNLAAWVINQIIKLGGEPEYIAIDMAYGQALYEKLSERYNTFIVPFSGKSDDAQYYNKRSEMYFNLAKAVCDGFYIDDEDVITNLEATTFQLKGDKILLDPKETIREAIGHSPDVEDALALTFLWPHNTTVLESDKKSKEEDASYYDRWMSGAF